MSDEATTTEEAPAKKQTWIEKKMARLAELEAENASLKQDLATKDAVKDHFDKIDGFKDEHDRAKEKHREQIAEAKERGVDPEEIIESDLDSSVVRAVGHKGREFLKAHHLRWVNKTSRSGTRVSYYKGKGFFLVRPSEHPVRPSHGIKEEDTWILGETILMAESMDFFLRNRQQALAKMLHMSGENREGTREQINQLIRDETGQPRARPGITKSYRDNTWDELREEAPIMGPHANEIPAA